MHWRTRLAAIPRHDRFGSRDSFVAGIGLRWAIFIVAIVVVGITLSVVRPASRSGKAVRPGGGETGLTPTAFSSADVVFLTCTNCHGDLDKVFKDGGAPAWCSTMGPTSPRVSDCSACDPVDTHKPDKIYKPTMEMCFVGPLVSAVAGVDGFALAGGAAMILLGLVERATRRTC